MTPTSLQTWSSHTLFRILIKILKGLSRFLARHTLAFALWGPERSSRNFCWQWVFSLLCRVAKASSCHIFLKMRVEAKSGGNSRLRHWVFEPDLRYFFTFIAKIHKPPCDGLFRPWSININKKLLNLSGDAVPLRGRRGSRSN